MHLKKCHMNGNYYKLTTLPAIGDSFSFFLRDVLPKDNKKKMVNNFRHLMNSVQGKN